MTVVKKFNIFCAFGGAVSNFTIYVGRPERNHHPLHFQSNWVSKERQGSIPQDIMDSMAKLKDISEKNNIPFEELCEYAIQASMSNNQNQEQTEETTEEIQ